jgi:anion-transporting  ArsA/GET3 family ATPase
LKQEVRPRLLFVTGKGGVGKSAIATALATAAARAGRRSLLVVQLSSDELHPLLGVTARYQPSAIETNLDLCSLDGRSALKEYVHRSLPLAGFYDWFLDSTALKHFTEAAPGFEELMCLGKLYDLVTASKYDLVVFDGPSTGHAALMLRVPRTTGAAVRTGPLHHNALKIELMLENDLLTRIVIVSLAEEMAIREALELATEVRGSLAMHLGPMIVNRVTPALFGAAEIEGLRTLADPPPSLRRMTRVAGSRFERATAEQHYIATLRAERPWVVEIPQIVLPHHDTAALVDGIIAHLPNPIEAPHGLPNG